MAFPGADVLEFIFGLGLAGCNLAVLVGCAEIDSPHGVGHARAIDLAAVATLAERSRLAGIERPGWQGPSGEAAGNREQGRVAHFDTELRALSGGWLAAHTLWRWKKLGPELFVSWADLKPVLSMLLPTIAYVVLIRLVGIYVASALFIAAFMIWRGRYGALPTLGASVGVPVILFLLFEVWFLVPLPKGPVERMLGY